MKKMVKVILAAAAVVALAVPAMAADKLIVKNAAGTADVFKVDDTGLVLGAKLAMGTAAPQAPFHLNLGTQAAGTLLYNSATGFAGSTETNTFQADFIVADNSVTPVAGYRGAVRGVRSRGTLAVPTVPGTDDQVFSIIGGIWDGGKVYNSADITFKVDGAVSSNVAPQRIVFSTRTGGTGVYTEKMVIKNDGKIILLPSAMPVYADNTAAASLTAGTLYRTSTGVLMIKY